MSTQVDAKIDAQTKALILSEALPHMQRYDRQTVVVKYGGHAMGDAELAQGFARDIVMLKQSGVNPVVVHGGGPQIAGMLDRLQIKSDFSHGLRVTNADTIDVVEMVLAGFINKSIVAAINAEGGRAVGISGKDANLMRVKKLEKNIQDSQSGQMQTLDLGFVGEPDVVDPHVVDILTQSDLIPIIAPTAAGPDRRTYNVNADTFASALAAAMQAKRLLLLTDVPGVLDKDGELIKWLSVEEARALIQDGTITDGMIPKIESCVSVIEQGVEAVVILNGKVPHAVLLELLTEHGAGTMLRATNTDTQT